MRKRLFYCLFASIMAAVLLVGCAHDTSADSQASATDASAAPTTSARVEEIVSSMTTEQKLAQMMIVTLRSDTLNTYTAQEMTPEISALFEKYDFGGVLLFQGNIESPSQTVTLVRDAQQAALNSKTSIPLFVAVDEEGGSVSRVPFGVTGSGNMALQATGDPQLIEKSAKMLGTSIESLGFNMNFAPVVDVNNNPNNPIIGVRSFSDDPNIVAEDCLKFLSGMKQAGVCTSLKHFPGHGNVDTDSHTGLPTLDLTYDELKECELIPFAAGIEAGTEMIMTAHIQYPNIEQQTYTSKADGSTITLPATLSHTILTEILRERLGYQGIIITDDMCMDAIAEHFDRIDAAVLAINAGADILLGPVDLYNGDGIDTLSDADTYISDLAQRVADGDISEERLNESVARILTTKFEKGIMDLSLATPIEDQIAHAEDVANNAEMVKADWEITRQAITLLKNDNNTLPFDGTDGNQTLILYPSQRRLDTVEYANKSLQEEGLLDQDSVTLLCYAELTAEDEELQNALVGADRVILLSQSASYNSEMASVLAQAQAQGKPVVLISLGVPYDVACYPEVDAVLCAYQPYGSAHDPQGNGPINMNVAVALADAFGESVPQGTLPVNIPLYEDEAFSTSENLYERGFGLAQWGAEA